MLDQPCQDSCLEFFISAAAHDARYLNIELNPNFCLYFGFGTGREDRMRILLPGGAAALNAACARTAGGWDVTYELPFRLLRLFFPEFVPSGTIRGNFYKCGGDHRILPYGMWSEVDSPTPDFHRPDCFGKFILTR